MERLHQLMGINSIKKLAAMKKYQEAIELCGKLVSDGSVSKGEILEQRASIYARMGLYGKSIEDRKGLLDLDDLNLKNIYQLARAYLSIKQYSNANEYLSKVLEVSQQQKSSWFVSSTLLMLSYSYMNIRDFSSAQATLDKCIELEPDISDYIPGYGMCSGKELKFQINEQRLQK